MSLSSTKGTYRLTLGDCDLLMADAIFMQRHNIHFIPNPIGKMLGRPQLLQLFPEKKISDTVHLFCVSYIICRKTMHLLQVTFISHRGGYINKHYNSSVNCSLQLFVIY